MESSFEDYGRRRSRSRKPTSRLRALADPRGVLMILLLVIGTILGGSIIPLNDFVIELIAILMLALAAIRYEWPELRNSQRGWIVAGLIALIAVYQLFPIPFSLWRSLPGREPLAQIYAATGLTPSSLSFSLDRSATITALLKTLPGLAAFIVGLSATPEQQNRWTRFIIGLCFAGAIQGVLQLMGIPGTFFYVETGNLFLLGPFSNHNHASDFFLIGAILLVPAVYGSSRTATRLASLAGCILLLLTSVLTASRFGMVLGLIPALFLAAPLLLRGKRRGLMIVACLIAASLGAYALGTNNYNLSRNLDRFSSIADDARPQIWRRSLEAAADYWPIGSGLGTFVPVYARGEPIESVTQSFVNHAHNDYIEISIELGAFGIILIAAYLGIYLFFSYKSANMRNMAQYSYGLSLLVLILHSTVDYPLRNLSLMIFFGLLSALFFRGCEGIALFGGGAKVVER